MYNVHCIVLYSCSVVTWVVFFLASTFCWVSWSFICIVQVLILRFLQYQYCGAGSEFFLAELSFFGQLLGRLWLLLCFNTQKQLLLNVFSQKQLTIRVRKLGILYFCFPSVERSSTHIYTSPDLYQYKLKSRPWQHNTIIQT